MDDGAASPRDQRLFFPWLDSVAVARARRRRARAALEVQFLASRIFLTLASFTS